MLPSQIPQYSLAEGGAFGFAVPSKHLAGITIVGKNVKLTLGEGYVKNMFILCEPQARLSRLASNHAPGSC